MTNKPCKWCGEKLPDSPARERESQVYFEDFCSPHCSSEYESDRIECENDYDAERKAERSLAEDDLDGRELEFEQLLHDSE